MLFDGLKKVFLTDQKIFFDQSKTSEIMKFQPKKMKNKVFDWSKKNFWSVKKIF